MEPREFPAALTERGFQSPDLQPAIASAGNIRSRTSGRLVIIFPFRQVHSISVTDPLLLPAMSIPAAPSINFHAPIKNGITTKT